MKKWIIPAIIILALASITLLRVKRVANGIWVVPIIQCQMEVYDESVQPNTTLVLSCPRTDSLRFWPLPLVQPWYEDWQEEQPRPKKLISG